MLMKLIQILNNPELFHFSVLYFAYAPDRLGRSPDFVITMRIYKLMAGFRFSRSCAATCPGGEMAGSYRCSPTRGSRCSSALIRPLPTSTVYRRRPPPRVPLTPGLQSRPRRQRLDYTETRVLNNRCRSSTTTNINQRLSCRCCCSTPLTTLNNIDVGAARISANFSFIFDYWKILGKCPPKMRKKLPFWKRGKIKVWSARIIITVETCRVYRKQFVRKCQIWGWKPLFWDKN